MTPREARIEIRRLKEHEAWLVNRFMDELKKDKREIARLRKQIREARAGRERTSEEKSDITEMGGNVDG